MPITQYELYNDHMQDSWGVFFARTFYRKLQVIFVIEGTGRNAQCPTFLAFRSVNYGKNEVKNLAICRKLSEKDEWKEEKEIR